VVNRKCTTKSVPISIGIEIHSTSTFEHQNHFLLTQSDRVICLVVAEFVAIIMTRYLFILGFITLACLLVVVKASESAISLKHTNITVI
jgi:hypothetical protein